MQQPHFFFGLFGAFGLLRTRKITRPILWLDDDELPELPELPELLDMLALPELPELPEPQPDEQPDCGLCNRIN